MKLLLLRVLLQRRARDEGFTLPMVIALGLVMILLGTTNIVKSSEENLNATIQNSSSDAFAIAEVGITKYREFLNQNRILTVYNHDQWDTNATVTAQTCADMNATPTGWTAATTDLNNVTLNSGDVATNANDVATNDNDNWWQIPETIDTDGDGDNDLIGQYRLVSYQYSNGNGVFDVSDDAANGNAVGTLTVQGRSPDGSQAQLRVEIPIRINPDDMSNLAPALWINDEASSTLDSTTIAAGNNIVIHDGAVSGNPGCDGSTAQINSNSVIRDARNVPSINAIANKITEAGTNINNTLSATLGSPGDNLYRTPDGGGTFDAATDCASITNCRYYYSVGGTTISTATGTPTGTATRTDGIAKVTLYVNGDLVIDRNMVSDVSSSYLEIYVTGNVDIDTDNVDTITALIHAPNGEVKTSGSGTVTINGSVWANTFVNGAGTTVNINPDTTRTSSRSTVPSYEAYTTAGTRFPRPLTSAPTSWTTEEVD